MADNKTITNTKTSFDASTNPDYTAATDEIGGVDYQEIKIVDGTKGATTAVAAGGGVEANALRVTIASDSTGVLSVDDNGGSITVDGTVAVSSGGGGTQYTEGDTDTTITGTAALMEAASSTLVPVQGTVADGLLVNMGTNNDIQLASNVAYDDISATQYLRVKLALGADGAYDMDVDSGSQVMVNCVPVTIACDQCPIDVSAATVTVTDNGAFNLAANSGVDIGDVTINNASGASAVNIQDGGNSITVDGTVALSAVVPGTSATSLGKAEDAVHASGDVGVMVLGVRNDAGTTVAADGDYIPLSIDSAGALRVTGGGGGTEYTEDAAAAANPVGGAQILVRQDTPATLVSADGDNVARRGTNYGAAYTQIVTSSGSYVDTFGGGTQYTEGDTDATITGTAMLMEGAGNALVAAQGTASDGLLVNLGSNNDVTVSSGTCTVTQLTPTNLNATVSQGTAANLLCTASQGGTWQVTLAPAASGGLTIYRNLDLDETGVNIKASAGQVYGYYIYNNAGTTRYVKLYNKATAPTVGTDTPVITIGVPAGSAANEEFANGITFGTGIGAGAVTGVADANTGAPSANDVVINIFYK